MLVKLFLKKKKNQSFLRVFSSTFMMRHDGKGISIGQLVSNQNHSQNSGGILNLPDFIVTYTRMHKII